MYPGRCLQIRYSYIPLSVWWTLSSWTTLYRYRCLRPCRFTMSLFPSRYHEELSWLVLHEWRDRVFDAWAGNHIGSRSLQSQESNCQSGTRERVASLYFLFRHLMDCFAAYLTECDLGIKSERTRICWKIHIMLLNELCVNVQVSNTVRSSTPFLFPYGFLEDNSSISRPSRMQPVGYGNQPQEWAQCPPKIVPTLRITQARGKAV